jgi:predicted secreted hydrolase/threonine/homoserine/homoserine lactone efflux protein
MSDSSSLVLETLLRGLMIGFSIAAPVGPIGVLCIRRTLSYGRWVGFISGLGAATADALYGSIAAFGLAFLASFLVGQQVLLRLVGGLFLLYLGVRTFLARPASHEAQAHGESMPSAYFSTFFLTLTNPLTILSFAAIFAGLGLTSQAENYRSAGLLVAGVFLGSASWWLILSSLADLFRSRMNISAMTWANRISGTIIVLFGAAALWGVFKPADKINPKNEVGGLSAPASTEGFTRADGTYTLTFPQDFGAHPTYQTEWWYYTGNLQDAQGQRFGYQLTFFRRAIAPPQEWTERASQWSTNQAYLAHFAITDAQSGDHNAFERLSRGAVGLAGADSMPFRVWLDDWEIREISPSTYQLHASVLPDQAANPVSQTIVLDLVLNDLKGPILQGDQGYSQKGPEVGNASYYFSQPHLVSQGTLQIDGKTFQVQGTSWMDHEFSTSALSAGQVGWDWFSIQLEDGSELMVFQIRRQDGAVGYNSSIDPYSSGTWIAPDGSTLHLEKSDFEIQVKDTWKSPTSGAVYPSRWTLRVPELALELELRPLIPDQELDLTYQYWEGAVDITGLQAGNRVSGVGYVELTGYGRSMAGDF